MVGKYDHRKKNQLFLMGRVTLRKKKEKNKIKFKKKLAQDPLDDLNCEIEVKEKRKVTFLSFSLFFTFLGNPPPKNLPKCGCCTHPPIMKSTPLCSPHDVLHGGGGFIVIG